MQEKFEVLLLDDEPIVGKRLKPALEKEGYIVEVFDNPEKALERIKQKEFDIVVTDICMQPIDGMDILQKVTEKSKRTKVIIITGYAMMELARNAMEKGAFDFIAKPFTPKVLRDVLAKAANNLLSEKNN